MKGIFNNNLLLHIISYSGITTSIRLVVGLLTQKVVAVFLGTTGMAVLSNFRNIIEIISSISSVGSKNGIIAQAASYDNKNELKLFLNSILSLIIVTSLIIIVLLLIFNDFLALELYLSASQNSIIKALSFTVPFVGLTVVLESFLSGKKDFKPVLNVQLATSITHALIMVALIYFYGLNGALAALIIRLVLVFFIYVSYINFSKHKEFFIYSFTISKSKIKELLPFIYMTLISTLFVHFIEIGIRVLITKKIDLNAAGLWTALNALSSNYFVVISSVFTLYVLPKFSNHSKRFNFLNEVFFILKNLLPFITVGFALVYFFRSQITEILFSNDFIEITSFFKWQILADWFRVIFLVFGYYLVSKKMLKKYFIIEFFSFLIIINLSLLLVDNYGIEGVVVANLIRYLMCLFLIIFLLRKNLFIR